MKTKDLIPFSVIVPHKHHLAKVFRKKLDSNVPLVSQNLPPGIVVDKRLVHPTINEFYLQSHMALQGTARPVRYIILKNTNDNATMDGFTELTNTLAYGYQINGTACSLPAPCMIARDYADRGARMYKEEGGTLDDLTNLRYIYSKFSKHRINA